MNKSEQASGDDHHMSVAGEGVGRSPGLMSGGGGRSQGLMSREGRSSDLMLGGQVPYHVTHPMMHVMYPPL